MGIFQPTAIQERVTDISPEFLKSLGVEALLLDVDNTLATYTSHKPFKGALEWVRAMGDAGFRMIIISNNFKKRVNSFGVMFGLDTLSFAVKPLPVGYLRAARRLKVKRRECAVIGDQVYPTANTTPESYELQRYFSMMADAGCEYMIMEVSSQGLKMHRTDGIEFDYGIFTNISRDHIGPGEHADFEEYLYWKSQLLNRCRVGLVNRDDPHFQEIAEGKSCRLFTFSLDREADFTADNIRYVSEPDFVGVDFDVHGACEMEVRVSVPGRFNVSNALAAVSVCSFLDLPREHVCHALEHLQVNGRMEIVYSSPRCTVLVDYAHNAVSMESLLTTLREYRPKRLVCVFGCGGNRSKDRRYSMGEIGGRLADLCILTADNSRYEKTEDIIADIRGSLEKTGGAYLEIPNRREAIAYSIVHSRPGDMIAVIGKGHEDYQEIEGVRYPFLDRQVIEETVQKLESGELTWNP